MSNSTKSTDKGLFSIGNIVTVILLIAVIIGYIGSKNDWFRISSIKNENTVTVHSIDELNNVLDYDISLPEFVTSAISNGSEVSGTVKQSNFSEIKVDNTLIGTCKFTGYGVDPIDIKDKAYTIDEDGNESISKSVEINKFSVENNNINHLEYIYNLTELEDCTLIIWSDNSANYSMLFGDKVDKETILKNWNINSKDLSKYTGNSGDTNEDSSDEATDTVTDIELNEMKSNNISINLPNGFETMESEGYNVYSLGGNMLIDVMYTKDAVDSDNFAGSGEIKISDTLVVRYNKENPFDKDTDYYDTYSKVLNSIEKIADSVKFTG